MQKNVKLEIAKIFIHSCFYWCQSCLFPSHLGVPPFGIFNVQILEKGRQLVALTYATAETGKLMFIIRFSTFLTELGWWSSAFCLRKYVYDWSVFAQVKQ